jgi:hypothetical protein
VSERGTGDVRDRPAPLREQMLRRDAADEVVVGQHAMAADVWVIVAVDHHDRTHGGDALEQLGIVGSVHRREHDAIHLPGAEHFELRPLLAGVFSGAAQQQAVPAGARD